MNDLSVVDALIKRLMRDDTPHRDMDDGIAEILGWSRAYETITDANTGETSQKLLKRWYPPGSQTLRRVPSYTSDLQCALDLASDVSGGARVGCSWDESGAHSVIGARPPVRARDVAMAVCAASLIVVRQKSSTNQ